MIKNFKWLLLVSLTFIACSKNDDGDKVAEVPLTAGTADFSKYVALGNSLTAGFSDNALFKKGQEGSYTNILATQFAKVGGGEFKIPYTNDNTGGLLFGGNPNANFGPRLYFNGAAPTQVNAVPTTEVFAPNTGGPYNNLGVPGAKSFHLISPGYGSPAGLGTGTANPYFVRFASSPGTSILADALVQNPTFFSLWIGNNDVLSYATSGGTGTNQLGNVNPATYGMNDITDPNVFANVYSTLIEKLTEKGAKGVIGNIPYVASLPFFTTIPTNPIPAIPAANAGQLNALFSGINSALAANSLPARFVTLSSTGVNPLLIRDKSLPNISAAISAALTPQLGAQTAGFLGNLFGQARHAVNTPATRDLILLSTRALISPPNNIEPNIPEPFNVRGVSYPLQDAAVLTFTEALEIKTATDAFNNVIKGLATTKGLAFVDANAVLNQVATPGGIRFGNFNLTSQYVTGGAFSLDGVHPSARGYALIANEFMKAINTAYGSTFRPVDLALYPIQYPAKID